MYLQACAIVTPVVIIQLVVSSIVEAVMAEVGTKEDNSVKGLAVIVESIVQDPVETVFLNAVDSMIADVTIVEGVVQEVRDGR